MEASSSSKVTVEYHDPSGVFPLVSHDIAARLPLRNLNWQSPSRPLRQIRQLHVDFIPDEFTETTLRPPAQHFDSNGPNSFDILRSGKDQRKDAVKERRHQIPGLKTSPYLKVYVLRCDDKDTYKVTERKRIREWVRENAQSDGRRGENHDAFAWIILHVVIPGTLSASEPRWRESQSEPDTLKERKTSNVKFPGKGTRTVFDRLRADFNESGKNAQDRVAQIRLLKSDVPPDLLPTPAVAETLPETPQERENAWKDLLDKVKTYTLGSFDARVRQYEADIAQQESRRSLPGWNFCTFFIHKEGLAKALESIGLVEDALAIYDELSLGLETAVRDLASGHADGTATAFASHTDDIRARILGTTISTSNGISHGENANPKQQDLFSKEYREQILRSNISVFDFISYIFVRRKALILRLANTKASRAELGSTARDGGEDLVLVSEVCWRASSFIHSGARTLRQDLANGPETLSQSDVEALVCSWTYAVAYQVLAETAAPVLELTESGNRPVSNSPSSPKRADFGFGMGANPYPQRSSSLAIRKSAPELQRPPSTPGGGTFSPPSSSGTDSAPKGAGIPGLPELTTYRAELVMMQRKMVEQLAEQRGWRAGWAAVRYHNATNLQEISLDDEESAIPADKEALREEKRPFSSLLSPALTLALVSEASFHTAYEYLSDQAMRYYALATQNKSVEVVIADLAMLRRQQGDFDATKTYLKHLLPSYATDGWSSMEAEMMNVYAECLKELGQKEEYVNAVLDLLAKVCGRKMTGKLPSLRLVNHRSLDLEDADLEVSALLLELVDCSKLVLQEITRPMGHYFSDIKLEREVMHLEDSDGFALRLRFRHLLDEELELDQVSARLVSVDDPNQEIWLVSDGSTKLKTGPTELDLKATTVAFGPYLVDKVILKLGKLRLLHELQPKPETPALIINDAETLIAQSLLHRRPFVFLYPSEHAFNVEVSVARQIHIDKHRHLEFVVDSGWNEIHSVDIKLRPTSAGLRLHLAQGVYEGVQRQDGGNGKPGQLGLGGLQEHSTAVVKVPYTLEHATLDISLRLEARYHTSRGSFMFLSLVTLRHELPLDVDVNDTFHLDTLFSSFTVCTTNKVPVVIIEANLDDSPAYAVEAPPAVSMPMTIFNKSPVKLLYKITRTSDTGRKINKRDAALALGLQYLAIDELLLATLRGLFSAHLQNSQFQALARLLLPIVNERCRQLLTSTDIEVAIMLGEAKVPSYEEFGWREVVATLPTTAQPELTQWLKSWHGEHPHIEIDMHAGIARATSRHMAISVDVPTIDVVFNTSLLVVDNEPPGADYSLILNVGRPVKSRVRVQHTKRWGAASISGSGKKGEEDVAFVLDVQADPDTWLVGGKRRAHFTPGGEEHPTFDLTLVPLRLGTHALPHVDIQPEVVVDGEGRSDKAHHQPGVSCETLCESAGQLARVIRNTRTTKAHIVESSATTGPLGLGIVVPSVTEPG